MTPVESHRFAREGFSVALMARSIEKLEPVAREIAKIKVTLSPFSPLGAGCSVLLTDKEFLQGAGPTLSLPTDASDPKSIAASFAIINKGKFVVENSSFQQKRMNVQPYVSLLHRIGSA